MDRELRELGAGNVGYHLASAFEEIWLQPSGDVGLTGVVARAVFVRDALDRLGVDPQLGQRHEYKTAADTFLRSGMSDAGREMARRLAESATETIVADVAAARGLDPATVREIVDRAPLTASRGDRGRGSSIGLGTATRSTPRCARGWATCGCCTSSATAAVAGGAGWCGVR